MTQALEGGDFINITSNDADAVIYCGDFNTEPGDVPHKILTQYYGLQDCHESAAEKLYTCFALENTYRECDGDTNPRAKTIDYIMLKSYFEARVSFSKFFEPSSFSSFFAFRKLFFRHLILVILRGRDSCMPP